MSPSKDLIFIMSGTNAYDLTLCADNNGECNITSPNYPNDYSNNSSWSFLKGTKCSLITDFALKN